ncbi:MAG: HlyD family secretion protein [Acidobacteriota bacterium]
MAKAGLLAFEPIESQAVKAVQLYSPIQGSVLRLFEQSDRVVIAGTPLLELGDCSKLEIVVDVLSSEAVKILVGADVVIQSWGGNQTLPAKVHTVSPSAFTKISALGVEEQCVSIIADFNESTRYLGNGYRIEASIILLEKKDILKFPISALFREGGDWCVFIAKVARLAVAKLLSVSVMHTRPKY